MRQFLKYAIPLGMLLAANHPAAADDAEPKRTHMSWEERFAQANTAHDGHLTLEEAKTGYKTVARHFHDIDTEGKGYVTENDVRAWHALQKEARHKAELEDPLRPRPAIQRGTIDQRTMNNTSANVLVQAPVPDQQP